MSTHPFKDRVNMNQLRFDLCGHKSHIPPTFTLHRMEMQIYGGFDVLGGRYDKYTVPIFRAEVFVTAHTPHPLGYHAAKHRVFIVCSCGRHIPAGRVTQHTHKE